MNRSFRAQESLMPSIRPRVPQLRARKEPTAKEKEEDLALFLEMRKREKEKSEILLHNSDEMDQSLGSQSGDSPLFNIPPAAPMRKTGADEFLNSDNDKNDYDWLLTPPGTPLFPSLDMESRKSYLGEAEAPNCHPTALKSRLANPQPEATKRSSLVSRQQQTSSTGLNSSSSGLRRTSSSLSSGGPASRPTTPSRTNSRPTTPTSRPTMNTSSRTSSRPSTPTSRPTISSTKPAMTSSTRSTASARSTVAPRSSTPSRPTPTTSKSTARSSTPNNTRSTARSSTPTTTKSAARSSTPTTTKSAARSSTPTTTKSAARSSTPTTSRSTARSSTPTTSKSTARSSTPTSRPTARSSTPASRPTATTTTVPRASSRPSTPTRRPSTPSKPTTSASAAASLNKSSSSVYKPGSPAPSARPKPWKPSEMPGFSLDAPPNLRTTLPDRPLSATRGRPPGAIAPRSNSVGPTTTPGRQRRQSCSPSRGRVPNHMSGGSVPAVNRVHSSRVNDEVSPVVMGNKMVERVINMRKLAPPKQDNKHSPSLSGKSASSPDNSGFGRSLSKKSLDMAIRHMDIRRTIPGNLRPLMTNIPASSMYSVRSGPARSRTVSVSDSPLATSSNASSELSVNNMNAVGMLDVNEMDDDRCSERGGGSASPTSLHGFRPFGR